MSCCIILLSSPVQEADEFKFTTNIMRWRHKRDSRGRLELGEDGRPLLETNTRLVKWSDGSMQLLVGDEAFDVGEHSIDRWGSRPGATRCVLVSHGVRVKCIPKVPRRCGCWDWFEAFEDGTGTCAGAGAGAGKASSPSSSWGLGIYVRSCLHVRSCLRNPARPDSAPDVG